MTLSGLEGSICTRKPISIQHPSYLLSYSFICLQNYNPFNLDLLWKTQRIERKWGNRGKPQIRAEKLQLGTSPRDNLEGNWWTAGIKAKAEPILLFLPHTQRKGNIWSFTSWTQKTRGERNTAKLIKQKGDINGALVFFHHFLTTFRWKRDGIR